MEGFDRFQISQSERQYYEEVKCFQFCVKSFKENAMTGEEKKCIKGCLNKFLYAEQMYLQKMKETMNNLVLSDPLLRIKFQKMQGQSSDVKSIVDLQYTKVAMSFSEKMKTIENMIFEDTERCLELISSKTFIGGLFCNQLKALVGMFESVLQRKGVQTKHGSDGKGMLRPQVVLGFYSLIIMRSSVISIRKETISNLASKVDLNADSIFSTKLATETLSKIYKSLDESDVSRQIICGLLLKIKGFSYYKMIVKDINPKFISDQTMNEHFDVMKTQCPNLLEVQLNKYKIKWGKYLRFRSISLVNFLTLLQKVGQKEEKENYEEISKVMQEIESQTLYILNRLDLLQRGQQSETLNIDQILSTIDSVSLKLTERLKQTVIVAKKIQKSAQMQIEYDFKHFIHKNYVTIYYNFLKIVNQMITAIGDNWLRKIKWLYNFVINSFINFDVRGNNFHQSIAQEYSKVFILMIQLVTNYLITFKNGLFPQGKSSELAFTQEFSIYKLVEALLYNQYPFDEAEAVQYQNYQKQRNNHDNKKKQYLIDVVNFNMKSLNLNLHWDSLLIKIIPNLKNSLKFGKNIIYQSLFFIFKYFEITNNYQEGPKLLLMLVNSRNSMFTNDKAISGMVKKIRNMIYPERKEIKEGIEYFCEEYFKEHMKYGKKRMEEEMRRKKGSSLDLCRGDEVKIGSLNKINLSNIKKTTSYESMLEGWQNFESVKDVNKDNSGSQMKQSLGKDPMFQSVESSQNQVFYSINESRHQKIKNAIQQQKEQIQNGNPQEEIDENEILMPQF